MIAFWIVAALLAAGGSSLILLTAARAGRAEAGPSPEAALYARHLAEVDELRARGLLGEEEHRAARAEAGRRLLAATDAAPVVGGRSPGGRAVLLAVVVGAPLLALGVYWATGRPGMVDQPYAARLERWRGADPARLPVGALAAVAEQATRERPSDPNAWRALGRARLAEGRSFEAVRALERAAQLGDTADDWAVLGEALAAQSGGAPGEQAAMAFREALKRDPASVPARYGLAQAAAAAGDLAGARTQLAALAASLEAGDPRRAALEAEVAELDRAGQ